MVSSVATGVGGWGSTSITVGVGGSMVSSVSTGVGGNGPSCDSPPTIGKFSLCGGTASVGSGMPGECASEFCDAYMNSWEINCLDNGTCTCLFNSQPYCQCAMNPVPPQCGGIDGYGCCPVIVSCASLGSACMADAECCSNKCAGGICSF
jgi:hypothetical protein